MSQKNIVNWDEIRSTASSINKYNDDIYDTLQQALKTINDIVPNPWSGEAAEETKEAFIAFDRRYKDRYYDLLNEYVKYLNDTAAEEHETGEQEIKSMANNIRDLIG